MGGELHTQYEEDMFPVLTSRKITTKRRFSEGADNDQRENGKRSSSWEAESRSNQRISATFCAHAVCVYWSVNGLV